MTQRLDMHNRPAVRFSAAILLCVTTVNLSVADEQPAARDRIVFEADVQKILTTSCVGCHNATTRKGGLNLSTPQGILAGGDSGRIFKAGDPDESLLVELIAAAEMPPDGKNHLSQQQLDTIRQWIAAGAKFAANTKSRPAVTQHDILPLLQLRCVACHGGRRQEAGLDLRTTQSILKGGESGPAAISGKPSESLIVQRVIAEEMPPRRKLVSVSVKPMEAGELRKLAEWIELGLPEELSDDDQRDSSAAAAVSPEDSAFWSFQPPKAVSVPTVSESDLIRNPIDAFVLQKLQQVGLTLSAEADRLTLLRRVSFNLTGLPPTPEEIDTFLTDTEPAAWERLVDRLLDSPRYGERWARHWLDVAGYADSEGAQNEDRVRPHMYRYRDYVIRSFNTDKPYSQFLLEQIAGDELADYENAAVIDQQLYDNLVATGFLRTAPDRTFANITNFVPDRLEVIADEMDILGSAVLGLTLKCARCHSHKFDPIPQQDYYRLTAIFKGAYDEHDWLKSQGPRTLPQVTTAERQQFESYEKLISDQIQDLQHRLVNTIETARQQQREMHLVALPPEVRQLVSAALNVTAADRSEQQTALLTRHAPQLLMTDEELRKSEADLDAACRELEQQISKLEARRRPEPRIRALWSRGEPSPSYVLGRGDYLTPGRPVEPGVPAVLSDDSNPFVVRRPWPGAASTGRRLAFAKWLTHPDHPLTARVMVNRVWLHHFGRGIVPTPGNFGKAGSPPTHPELLDWLAQEFVRQNWSLKALHRLIVTSAVYRQSADISDRSLQLDPDGSLLSRMPMQRLDAEVLRDTLLFVAGQLDSTPYGPADAVSLRPDGLVTSTRSDRGWRRSIYVLQRRTQIPTLLDNFDYPQMGPNCVQRNESLVAPQALHLMNNKMVFELAQHFAQRVRSEVGDDPADQVRRAYLHAFGRPAASAETQIAVEALVQLTDHWAKRNGQPDDKDAAKHQALTSWCHAVMNMAEFLYVD